MKFIRQFNKVQTDKNAISIQNYILTAIPKVYQSTVQLTCSAEG